MNRKNFKYILLLVIVVCFAGLSHSIWFAEKSVANRQVNFNRGTNGLWMEHGWLGADSWFRENNKPAGYAAHYRQVEILSQLAAHFNKHDISDLFPHLAPTNIAGSIPAVNHEQTQRFLKAMNGFRVMPWVGGVLGKQVFLNNTQWRDNFTASIKKLLVTYPKFSGIHINIEPNPSGNQAFLELLEEIRAVMPAGKVLSIAAFPPPFFLQPYPELHWEKIYYEKVASRADQLVVMSYDTALPWAWAYRWLMAVWTKETIEWSDKTPVLIGIPAYNDKWASYHDPDVENMPNALAGINSGLSGMPNIPSQYQGVAIYSGWEMTPKKWSYFKYRLSNTK